MKDFTLVFVFMTLLFSGTCQTITQDVISNGGETYEQINGSVQFNIGETIVETYSNPDSPQMYNGFEQGSYSLVGVEENLKINNLEVNIFPNPTQDDFVIKLDYDYYENFYFSVTDNVGKIIYGPSKINNISTQVNLSNHERGLYQLIVTNEDLQYQKAFKILKQ